MTSRSRCDLIVLGGTFVLRRFNIADHSDEANPTDRYHRFRLCQQ